MRTSPKTWAYSILARTVNLFVKAKAKHWVFASNLGKTWGEGSRNIMLYVMKNDPSIQCTYITQNYSVYRQLKKEGIPCEHNWTLKGILAIAKSDSIFFTHAGHDIDYAYKKEGRRFYYLIHGQSYKVALNCLKEKKIIKTTLREKFRLQVSKIINGNLTYNDSDFVSCCSDFIAQFTRREFDSNVEIDVLGSPRNDILFHPEHLINDFLEGLKDKYIVTYMPTHRAYGKGKPSPILFINNEQQLRWLRENGVVVLIKQHPNMIPQIKDTASNDVIIDITKLGLDPQCVMVYSDVMVTDYSSVWMDWLLLGKPLLHYFYDDFGTEDAGFYYDLHEDPAGKICESEQELFNAIVKCKLHPETMLPSEESVSKYHKFKDGNACKRHYEKIMKRYER